MHHECQQPFLERHFKRGETIYFCSFQGPLWVITQGLVRLDATDPSKVEEFSHLGLTGDVLGLETLTLGHYGFTARALTPCTLVVQNTIDNPLEQMTHQLGLRLSQLMALRAGSAVERLQRFIRLITQSGRQPLGKDRQHMPLLADIAEITGLTIETVSRAFAQGRDTLGFPHKTYRPRKIGATLAAHKQTCCQPLAA